MTVSCLCGRENCGLGKKLDDVDADNIWLPAGYLNHIKGSSWLGAETDKDYKGEVFADRKEAVEALIKDLKKTGRNRYDAPI